MEIKDRIIIALDNMTEDDALYLAYRAGTFTFKIHDLFLAGGPQIVKRLSRYGEVFLDLKFFDIPATVANEAKRVTAIPRIKAFSVHAFGGLEMMKEAVKNKGNCQVFAVTVLSSFSDKDCQRLFGMRLQDKIIQLAYEAKKAGVDGIICSGADLEFLSLVPHLKDVKKIATSIRPLWAEKHEQKRTVTPAQAIRAGAEKIIIGRPITQPPPEIGSSLDALKKIVEEIEV